MSYTGDSLIHSAGNASAAAIDAWMARKGQQLAPGYAPDKRYKAPPPVGEAIVRLSREVEVNSDFVAAQICKESAGWQSAIVRDKNNPSGLGAVNDNAYGGAVTFDTPEAGIQATIAHLLTYTLGTANPWWDLDPRATAVPQRNLGVVDTLSDLDGKWAWPGQGYGAGIANLANDLVQFAASFPEQEQPPMRRQLRIALAAGHRNADGGNQLEASITGPLCKAYADEFRRRGADVRVITPNDGLGHYSGGLQDVAQQVVNWAQGGWVADLFLETHTEGAGGRRGVFGIYPDWGSDVDVDARDRLIPLMVEAIAQATGLPIRGNGVMSEKNTGVGGKGHRLGVFLRSAPVAATTTRLLIEHGAHDAPDDLAIIQSPGFPERVAKAGVAAVYEFYGMPAYYQGGAPVEERIDPETGYRIIGGMLAYIRWLESEIGEAETLMLIGRPISNEYVDEATGLTVQDFERARLEWHPGSRPDRWDILLGRVNAELIETRSAA